MAEEHLYSSESALKSPIALIRHMVKEFGASWGLGWHLFLRDLRSKYRESFFGLFWVFSGPLAMAVGFTVATRSELISVGETRLPYPAYVFISSVLLQTFVSAFKSPLSAVSKGMGLMSRVRVPTEAIFLSHIFNLVFEILIKLILVVGVFFLYDVPVSKTIVYAPLALLSLFCFAIAAGLLYIPFAYLYKDVSRVVSMLLGYLVYLTPVIYPPPTGNSIVDHFVRLNPATPLVVTTRELATAAPALTYPTEFLVVSSIGFLGLFFAWVLSRVSLPFLVERASA